MPAKYRYDKRDEHVYDQGHAAYVKDGAKARNPYDPRKLPISHGAWQCGRDAAYRESKEPSKFIGHDEDGMARYTLNFSL